MVHQETTQERPRGPDDAVGLDKVRAQAYEAAALGEATPGPGAQPWLLAGLKAQQRFLQATVVFFQRTSGQQTLTRAAEWMLDNFHLAQQSLRQIREDLPRGFYRTLPKLAAGPMAGYPRIYDVAQQLVVDSDAQLDMQRVQRFVLLYQDVRPLTTGELWALPIMLRLSILAALAQAAGQITNLMQQGDPPFRPLSGSLTGDEIVANCFTSLRTIGTHDWQHFFESVSRVEQILRDDPAAVYAGMDRATRDQYRHVVEELALATGHSELEVARMANALAQAAWTHPPAVLGPVDGRGRPDAAAWPGLDMPPAAHVGYYLLDDGRAALEGRLGYRPSPEQRLARLARGHPAVVYLGPIALLTLLMLAAAAAYAVGWGGSAFQVLLSGLLVLLPMLAAAVALIDWVVTLAVRPRILPKLNLSSAHGGGGIPDSCRTLVVVPAMLSTAHGVSSLLQQIEQHYLRNPDHNLYFALLTDFGDAPRQNVSGDTALLEQARVGIEALNVRYSGMGVAQDGPFCMFHRERRWNAQEGRWIGWERKRGKLHELNCWLRGAVDTSIVSYIGRAEQLRTVKYVITLDADTILGPDGARRLIGTLAHPLNHARADPSTGRVVHGYGLLQPRTEITPTSANHSRFSRIFAGDIGLDLYTHAVSNVYQDLFGSGIYIGKGIYDLDAFEYSLVGRVPENALLSHDLFEGIHARAGLVTDTVLYEDYPPSYLAYVRRQCRWTRGDWQLLPWLLPRAPGLGAGRLQITAGFGVIDTWKLLDNLRRSLLPPAQLLLLIAGWLYLPGAAWVWTAVAVLAPAIPALIGGVTPIATGRADARWRQSVRSLKDGGLRWLLAVVFLPFEAAQMLGAIATTLARMLITHRHLLEWTTAAKAAQRDSKGGRRRQTWKDMLSAPMTALALALLLISLRPEHLLLALPLLLAWALAPEIAYRISRPIRHAPTPLTAEQQAALRSLARRTWLFFEDFVGPNDHWLPPDHFQESPRGTVAPYTSPTNIGLLLLSTLAAYDLGYIGIATLVARLSQTFESLARLERFRGHFLNWYNTRTLEPMPPRYVSTVDSGNFAVCLRILGQACQHIPSTPVLRWQRWEGMADTFALLDDFVRDLAAAKNIPAAGQLRALARELREHVLGVQADPDAWLPTLDYIARGGWQRLEFLLRRLVEENAATLGPAELGGLRIAIGRIRYQISMFQHFSDMVLPGRLLLDRPPQLFGDSSMPVELGESYRALVNMLPADQTLDQVPEGCAAARAALAQVQEVLDQLPPASIGVPQFNEARTWCRTIDEKLAAAQALALDLLAGLHDIDRLTEAYFHELDFAFLFDPQRQVFHIGYNVTADKLDGNFYDLLASEARIASLVALAKHEVPQSHWLHLARPITRVDGTRALLSWSATMFEYLMPTLFMRSYPGTLLHESAAAAVELQIAYGRRKGVPWGISESGYYAFDASANYQYQAFGVPGLGFKRNLADDLVITPYASLLALPFAAQAVAENLERLTGLGALGVYGLYEALDFSPARLPLGEDFALVQEYMAHHQGMILVAIDNYLSKVPLGQDGLMRQRFHSDPLLQSVDLLLQERVPAGVPLEFPRPGDLAPTRRAAPPTIALPWEVPAEGTPMPHVHYLSNGRYSVLITASGGGLSRWEDLDLTRWCADTTLEDWGTWLYVQDRDSGALWSAAYQPAKVVPDAGDVRFYAHKAEFRRTDHEIALTMEIAVAPDDDIEIRRVTMHNQSERPRKLALTSYGEVVMAAPLADQRHPAFNKLFIESEYLPELDALLFRRRPRAESAAPVFLAHLALSSGDTPTLANSYRKAHCMYESDRARFLGRGPAAARAPAALGPSARKEAGGGLSGTVGATLDPIMSLQREIDLQPGQTVQLAFLTLAADSRAKLLDVAGRYLSWPAIEHAIGQARSRAELELRQSSLSTVELERIQTLLSALLYPQPGLRTAPATLAANTRGQPALWAYGISGDYPILLVRLATEEGLGVIQELLQAHAYWRKRGLKIDLLILNQRQAGYNQDLRDQIQRLLALMHSDIWLNQRSGIFILNAGQLNEADRILLEAAAQVALDADQTGLETQLDALLHQPEPLPPFAPERPMVAEDEKPVPPVARPAGLAFDNGLGGFSSDGREYVIYLDPGQQTPAPWVNVVANPEFGFLVSESGSGYTWALNSGENRLTPWSNDPVTDRPGEALYLRDEETGEVWSPTPQPCGATAPYLVRHGAGYTVFEHHSHALRQRLRLFVPPDNPVKIIQLRLENATKRPRRITATFYAEWVLGVTRAVAAQFVIPEFDDASQALLARNPWNPDFAGRVAFAAASRRLHGLTVDRSEFLGRLGSLAQPEALGRIGLSSTVQAGLDPCVALQLHIDLPPGGSEEVWFLLGQGTDRAEAVALAMRFQDPDQVQRAWLAVNSSWDNLLGAVQVHTPDPAMDLLLNRWLLYQSLSCRIWGRSAFYQSGGAFGFRDQLQDVMALVHAAPEVARRHILAAAGRQFEEGDVLHWWHPPSGRGVRTRCSDDLLWLPFVTTHYIEATGDRTILDEQVPFLQAAPLGANEEDRYDEYCAIGGTASLYEHCRRALERGTTSGDHGLPLMGSSDWNDGMSRVGAGGRGESVWLGWFLHATLSRFAATCERCGGAGQAATYRQRAETLKQALEESGWDGDWYLRAFYDDGTPLGSARDAECQIDSIAQSWAVLSGAGESGRAVQAMDAVQRLLVRTQDRLVLLFTPPFDETPRDPGYIKDYPPGIRENGGQYTHAALWSAWAFAELGQSEMAERVFRILNPIYHADTRARVDQYKVEPYVVAADIYGKAPHIGRGGWTWYTGSAAWMYRLGLEGILGLHRAGAGLIIDPHIPTGWPGYEVTYRFGNATYRICVRNGRALDGDGTPHITVDGESLQGNLLALHDDGEVHQVQIVLGGSDSQ